MNTIYSFWTGDNDLTPNRKKIVDYNTAYFRSLGIDYVLVTEKNLDKYIEKANVELHKGYKLLSFTHRSDYLRCYFMRFFGGGYLDLKRANLGDWKNALTIDDNAYVNGSTEVPWGVARCHGNDALWNLLKQNYMKLVCCCGFVCKANTPFVNEWYDQMIQVMDKKYDLLVEYPGRHPREGHGDGNDPTYKYPIIWTELVGNIFHPLCLKYSGQLRYTLPGVSVENYR